MRQRVLSGARGRDRDADPRGRDHRRHRQTGAAIPGRAVAGKTGTTENYGDAWFVGYTPQLDVAVWVGYPTRLKPMLTEFHGKPVVGGTFPALILKTFTESALSQLQLPAESFPAAPFVPGTAERVAYRDGQTRARQRVCRDTQLVVYFDGRGPAKTADCKLNEVDVPNVVGHTLAAARTQLEAQPLTAEYDLQAGGAGPAGRRGGAASSRPGARSRRTGR